MKLPTEKSEELVLWTSDEDGGDPRRVVLICDGAELWTMEWQTGCQYDDGLEWEDGGAISPDELGAFNLAMAKMFAHSCDRTLADMIDMMAKGKSEIPLRKPVILARMTGSERWRVTLTTIGDSYLGEPLFTFEQSRPLGSAEWFVVCRRIAKALDWYEARMER